MRQVELRELPLPGPVGLLRPGREALGVDELLLQPVDPRHDPGHERRGARAEVVLAQGQVVEPLEEHREAVRARERHDERVQAGLERLVVQEARAHVVHRVHGELLVRPLDGVLEPRAHPLRRRRGGDEHEDRLRVQAVGEQPAEALDEHGRLAGPGPRDDEDRPAGMPDDACLGRGEDGHGGSLRPGRTRAGTVGWSG